MTQENIGKSPQAQKNIVEDIQFGDGVNTFNFAPVQIDTQIETQIIQISVAKVTQQALIKASPYKGLKRFNFADRDRFFGRDVLIRRLLNAVNKSSLSLVLGASGSGKSSVVRAGVIAEFKKSFQTQRFYDFVFTPGQDPFSSFYRCLLSEEKDYRFSEVEVDIVRQPGADTLLRSIQKLKKENEYWLLFIDQFEELFTNCRDVKLQQSFISGLVQVAKADDSTVRIVLAMRSDFLEQLSAYPAFGEILNQDNLHLVTDMHPDELRQAIEQPAAKNGVVIEEGLVEQIIKDIQGQTGYLPLLQYTLDILWESECQEISSDGRFNIEDRMLNCSTYNALEGVRGALQNRVNKLYQRLDQNGKTLTKQIFLRLVNIVDTESGSRAVSRRAYRSEFSEGSIVKILQLFIDENLLVSSYEYLQEEELSVDRSPGRKQRATVELAHEVLLSSWDALRRWLEEEKESIILKNWLSDEARRWYNIYSEDEDKAKDELLKGSRLDQIIVFAERNAFKKLGGLTAEEKQFVDVSVEWRDYQFRQAESQRKREIKQARRIAFGSIGAAVVMAGLAGIAGLQLRRAEIEQIQNSVSLSESYLVSDQGLQARVESVRAGTILQKSLWQNLWPEQSLRESVLIQLQKTLYGTREVNNLPGLQGSVNQVALSDDGNHIAASSENGLVQVWNRQGKVISTLEGHQGMILDISFNPESSRLVTSGDDGTVRLWDLEGKQLVAYDVYKNRQPDPISVTTGFGSLEKLNPSVGPEGWVWTATFTSDGRKIITGDEDGKVQLWDLEGNRLADLKGHEGAVWDIQTAPNNIIATRGEDSVVRLWDSAGQLSAELEGHQGSVWDMAFHPAKPQLVTSGNDGTIRLWDLQGRQVDQMSGHKGPVTSVAYGSNGLLATRGEDGTARIWDFDKKLSAEIESQEKVWDIVLNPEGNQLILLKQDGTISFGTLSTQQLQKLSYDGTGQGPVEYEELKFSQLDEIKGHQGKVWQALLTLDGEQLTTVSEDGTARIWDLKSSQIDREGISSWISPDSSKIATINKEDGFSVWDVQGSLLFQLELPEHLSSSSSNLAWNFSPDSRYLIASAGSNYYNNAISFLLDIETKESSELKGEMHQGRSFMSGKDDDPAFSPDQKKFVTADRESVYLWDLKGNLVGKFPGGFGAFTPDNRHLITFDENSTLILWDFEGEKISEFVSKHSESEMIGRSSVTFSPDFNYLAVSDGSNLVEIWDAKGNFKTSFETQHEGGMKVAFTPDSNQLVTTSFSSGAAGDRSARLWDLQGNKLADLLEGERRGQVTQIEFTPDKKTLLVSSDNGSIYHWDFQGILLNTIPRPPVWGNFFKFSPDGKYLAVAGGDSSAKIWRFLDDRSIQQFVELKGHLGQIKDLEFHPRSQQIITNGDDGTIRFWNFKGQQLFQLKELVNNIEFSSDENKLIGRRWESDFQLISIWQAGDIDSLLGTLCFSIQNYLTYNESVTVEDKQMCQGITEDEVDFDNE